MTQSRNVNLDLMRAVAILVVMVFHYDVMFKPAFGTEISRYGWVGVDLFFVLSGFLISRILLTEYADNQKISLSRFYLRRCFRILPPYLVMLALYLSFPSIQEGRGMQELWRYLTFTQNLPADLARNTFSHSWSLAVEEHFYLVLPLCLLLFSGKTGVRAAVGVAIAGLIISIGIRLWMWYDLQDVASGRQALGLGLIKIYYPTYTRLDGLAVGVLVSALALSTDIRGILASAIKRWCVLGASLLLFIGSMALIPNGKIINPAFFQGLSGVVVFLLVALSFGGILIWAIAHPPIAKGSISSIIRSVAIWSYPVYLSHKAVYAGVDKWLELSPVLAFAVSMILALFVGWLFHRMIEVPFLRLRDHWYYSRQAGNGKIAAND